MVPKMGYHWICRVEVFVRGEKCRNAVNSDEPGELKSFRNTVDGDELGRPKSLDKKSAKSRQGGWSSLSSASFSCSVFL